MKLITYLALGDSYTIGEQVQLAKSFPYQTVEMLRKSDVLEDNKHHLYAAPEIIAKTGWTTDELANAIGQTIFLPKYDMVSLLIGVNNQYRGRPLDEFRSGFELLIQMAIQFAGGIESNVFILSIPDWGVTNFAKDLDHKKIASEINAFNDVCKRTAEIFNTNFINITDDQRLNGNNADYLTNDGLHPSGKEYKQWAIKLSQLYLAK